MISKFRFLNLSLLISYFRSESLDPNYNYNGLDSIRKILGYSYFLDFVFRKLASDWWWAIVPKREVAAYVFDFISRSSLKNQR
jgi:hypothetical protein